MTWWQTLLVTVAPVLLTLVITNYAEDRRNRLESVERKKDRDVVAANRFAERKHALEDTYRSERRHLYETFLVVTHTVRISLESTILAAVMDELGELRGEERAPAAERKWPYDVDYVGVEPPLRRKLEELVSQIDLMGGEAVRTPAQELLRWVEEAQGKVETVQRNRTALEFGSIHAFTRPFREYRAAFAAGARSELGTEPVDPSISP